MIDFMFFGFCSTEPPLPEGNGGFNLAIVWKMAWEVFAKLEMNYDQKGQFP